MRTAKNREATASSWRTCPKVNARRTADPSVEGAYAPIEEPAHRAVPHQRHIIEAVRARGHPRHQGRHLQARVRPLVGRHREPVLRNGGQFRTLGEFDQRDQPRGRHEIRVIERHHPHRAGMRELLLRDALP